MESIIKIKNLSVAYQKKLVIENINLEVFRNEILALIGPSGSGKSTLIRSCNRLNDLIPQTQIKGEITYKNENIYQATIDPVKIRRQIGMVFQKPNPFPKSIYENIAFGLRVNGFRGNLDQAIELALVQAGLWEEVKDKLKQNSLLLSGGQQQRLCIARAIALKPQVILMDEPCSALDPLSTEIIEQLLLKIKYEYTIVIVTHNLQQAKRISDRTAFLNTEINEKGDRVGRLIEWDLTGKLFDSPQQTATLNYVQGRFG